MTGRTSTAVASRTRPHQLVLRQSMALVIGTSASGALLLSAAAGGGIAAGVGGWIVGQAASLGLLVFLTRE